MIYSSKRSQVRLGAVELTIFELNGNLNLRVKDGGGTGNRTAATRIYKHTPIGVAKSIPAGEAG